MDAIDHAAGRDWVLYNGDCVEVLAGLPSDSVGFSVFSPPFANLYTYSNSDRDLGNCADAGEFFTHFRFVMAEIARVLMPGRSVAMHCMDLPTSKVRDGYIGLYDFPADLRHCAEDQGLIYHSSTVIWKDPVTAMQRTKALGLLHKTIRNDSSMSRMGIPDRVIVLRKPGENPFPIRHEREDYPVDRWQRVASPVWMDIDPSDTLQYRAARDEADERHICPLQLEVIRRCIELWSAPGDVVLSPFAGIGSEIHVAVEMGRKGIGIELKPSYWAQAVKNLEACETALAAMPDDLFSIDEGRAAE
jgi:DNA modification methylase